LFSEKWSNKIRGCLLMVGLLVFMSLAGGFVGPRMSASSGPSEEVVSLRERISSLEQEVRSSKARQQELEKSLKTHRQEVNRLEDDLRSLSYRKVLIQNAIMDLNHTVDRALSYRIADHLVEAADKQGFDPFLVISIMHIESNFDPHARSGVGARGLMQVMPFWCPAYDIRARDLWTIKTNIRTGVSILDSCMKECDNDLRCALARYHGSYPRYWVYADKVMDVYEEVLEKYETDPEETMLEELKKKMGKHASCRGDKLCTRGGECMVPF